MVTLLSYATIDARIGLRYGNSAHDGDG